MKESVASLRKEKKTPKIIWFNIIPAILICFMLTVAFCIFLMF